MTILDRLAAHYPEVPDANDARGFVTKLTDAGNKLVRQAGVLDQCEDRPGWSLALPRRRGAASRTAPTRGGSG